ncbi:MAG: hypothetical protein MZV65_25325 [Chromatiales bacterium]|nr:hypothetical protein [Chromatiales bacterium]
MNESLMKMAKCLLVAKGLKAAGEKLSALATVGGPQNQTFLATIRATLDSSDYGDELTGVLEWFEKHLTLINPNTPVLQLGYLLAQDVDLPGFASDFLKSSSTGVDHIEIVKKELTEDQLRSFLPEDFVSKVINNMQEEGTSVVHIGDGKRFALNEQVKTTIIK